MLDTIENDEVTLFFIKLEKKSKLECKIETLKIVM